MSKDDKNCPSYNLHEIYFRFMYVPLPQGSEVDPKNVDAKLADEVRTRISGDYVLVSSEIEAATDFTDDRASHVIRRTVTLHATNVPLHRIKLIPALREVIAAMRDLWKSYAGGELCVVEGDVIIDLPGHHNLSCCSMRHTHTLPGVRTTDSQIYHVVQKELQLPAA